MKELKSYIETKKTRDPNRTAIHTTIPKDIRAFLSKRAINITATFENFLIALVEELKEEDE